ncbi:MAG: alpha/beta fold hydrolase [Thermodesulfobacteriota bacterium]
MEMNKPVRKTIEVDGAEISALEAGPEQGLPVVCVHGIPTGAELWRDVITRLAAAGYRAYAPDMPGYGQTRMKAGGDYSLAGAAEAIASWMQQRDIAPAAFVAHDIGGGAVEILSVRYPELVDQIVFSNAIVGDSWPVAPLRMLQWLATMRLFSIIAASGLYHIDPYLHHQLKRCFADPKLAGREDIRNRIFFDGKMVTPVGRRAFACHLNALDNTQTKAVEPQLAELDVSVLLLWGGQDPFQPWQGPGKRLQEWFPRADVEIIDNAGHFSMLDQPGAYAERLICWLDAECEKVDSRFP